MTDKPSSLRTFVTAVGRVTVTTFVIAAAAATGVAGYGAISARAAATEDPEAAPLTLVAPEVLVLQQSVSLPRRFTGQFEAAQEVALGFEEGGTIAEVLVREGDAVAAGEIIARLDTRLLHAERDRLAAARDAIAASTELSRRTNERQAALLSKGHVAQQRADETSLALAQLEATMAETEAALDAVDVRLSKSKIVAPFTGRIGARLLDAGAVAGPGAAVVTMLENAPARFRVSLDPALADRLEPGAEFRIETVGTQVAARFSELSPDLDIATRGRVAFFDLAPGTPAPPVRTAGDLVLSETFAENGAWVPLAALRQGPRGAWTILTVTDRGDGTATVALEAAEVLHLDSGRAFVRGSFKDGALFLPDGTHRVVPGQTVRMAEPD